MENSTNNNVYSKRPLWQWILLYIAVGALAYGLFYYFVLNKNGNGYSQNTNTPAYTAPAQGGQQTSPSQTPTPSPSKEPTAPHSFSIHANDTSADLTTITVSKGSSVQITFNVDATGTYHGGLDFRSSVITTGAITPGSSKTITFTADNSFSFIPYWPSTNIQKPYTISVVVE